MGVERSGTHRVGVDPHDGDRYDVALWPTSPKIDPLFDATFPEKVAIPTGSYCYLSHSDRMTRETFNCRYEDNFRRRFERTVGPLLLNTGIAYLDQFQTVEDIMPVIRHPYFLGFALDYVGRHEEARSVLLQEKERLSQCDQANIEVALSLQRIDEILNRPSPGQVELPTRVQRSR